jgi:hypothetical protein
LIPARKESVKAMSVTKQGGQMFILLRWAAAQSERVLLGFRPKPAAEAGSKL